MLAVVVAIVLWLVRLTSPSVILSVALSAALVIDPSAVLAPGFWLSFGAVALILARSSHRKSRQNPRDERKPCKSAGFLFSR